MTTITFYRDSRGVVGFRARGHAGFADPGEDIVCAAISMLTQTTVIGLQDVVGIDARINIQEGQLECFLPKKLTASLLRDSQVLLETMLKGLEGIKDEYGDFLQIREVHSHEN